MSSFQRRTSVRVVKILNILLMTAVFGVMWYVFYADTIRVPFYNKGNWVVIGIFTVLYSLYGRTYDAFKMSLYRISEMVYSQTLAAFFADAVMYVIIWLLNQYVPAVWPLLLCLGGQIVAAVIWSYAAHKWYYFAFPARKTAIIYDRRPGMEQLIKEYGLSKKFDVVAVLPVQDCLDKNMEMLDGVEVVFLSGIHSHERNLILKYCVARDIQVYMLPRVGDVLVSSAKQMHLFHLPMLQITRYEPIPEYLIIKRLFDIVVSGMALLVLSPIMIAVSIAIKAYDGGPVMFTQKRMTLNRKEFVIHKFRSMKVDADKGGKGIVTMQNDDRITPVGKFIRACRLDELPQLYDIFIGNMTIVGPRPERLETIELYEKDMPEFGLRLQVKAGLTGYAQVYGKANTSPYDKLQMDLMYIGEQGVLTDLKIILATIKILFMPESTEGFAEEKDALPEENAANK